MLTKRWSRLAALALAGGVAAACETGTGPEDAKTFDAERAIQNHAAFEKAATSGEWLGFQVLGQYAAFQSVGGTAVIAANPIVDLDGAALKGDARAFTAQFARRLAQLSNRTTLAANPVISSFHRGKTFVYDPERDDYVVDPERTDAPETGVRFVLYDEGADGKPDPESERGYADLIDEGDDRPEDAVVRLVVVWDERTVLDYGASVNILDNGGHITVLGFVQGEEDRLDFDIDVTGTEGPSGSQADIQFDIGIEARDFMIIGSVTGMDGDTGESGEIDLTVRHGDDSFRVDVKGSETSIEGTIYLNGDVLATVSGDPDDPTFTGASGGGLTASEIHALGYIAHAAEHVFKLFEALVAPVGPIVFLAVIL